MQMAYTVETKRNFSPFTWVSQPFDCLGHIFIYLFIRIFTAAGAIVDVDIYNIKMLSRCSTMIWTWAIQTRGPSWLTPGIRRTWRTRCAYLCPAILTCPIRLFAFAVVSQETAINAFVLSRERHLVSYYTTNLEELYIQV